MRTLRIFYEVAKQRSFSLAAKELGITQSAASQRIGQLEKQLGVTLFDRSVRPLTLTGAGQRLESGVRQLLTDYDRLLQEVVSLPQSQLVGSVHVEAIYSAGIGFLEHAKEAFEADHPRVSVRMEFARPETVHERVVHHRCDIGILSHPTTWRDVGVIPLRDELMAVACSASHPLAQQSKVHASELKAYRMAGFDPSLSVGRLVKRYLREHGVSREFHSVFDNIDSLKTAVEVTDQVAIIPKRTALREVAAGRMKLVDLEPELLRPMGVIYPKDTKRGDGNGRASFPPPVQAFIDFLLQRSGPEGGLMDEQETLGQQLVGGKV